jgi:hypothetical protein
MKRSTGDTAMTLQEKERELDALDRDAESVTTIVSELDTTALHMIAEAIRTELTHRYEGKPLDRRWLH